MKTIKPTTAGARTQNPMNPENIEAGDTVQLHDHDTDTYSKPMKVESVGGSYGNKVYCPKLGREYYATCFRLVSKGTK